MNMCKKCSNILNQDYNYCPYCSNPLTSDAILLEKKKLTNIRLETLLQLLTIIDDETSLNRIKVLIGTIESKSSEN